MLASRLQAVLQVAEVLCVFWNQNQALTVSCDRFPRAGILPRSSDGGGGSNSGSLQALSTA